MADSDMLDDIKALLDGDFGDDRILREIYQACKNREVISNYERRYVRDLTERYLDKGDGAASKEVLSEPRPDVLLPGTKSAQDGPGASGKAAPAEHAAADAGGGGGGTVKLISSKTKRTRRPMGKIVAAALAMVIVVVVVAVAAAIVMSAEPLDDEPGVLTGDGSSGSSGGSSSGDAAATDPIPPGADGFFIRTDLGSYSEGDFIQVSGMSDAQDSPMTIRVVNPAGSMVWIESVDVKTDGTYSTIIISGGGGAWGGPGEFTIEAEAPGGTTASSEFVVAS